MSDFPIIELELTLFQELTPTIVFILSPRPDIATIKITVNALFTLPPPPHKYPEPPRREVVWQETQLKKITCHLLFLWLVIFTYGGPESQLSLVLRYHPALGGWLHKVLNKIHKLCMFFASWNCAVSKVLILEWSCQTLISDISTIHTAFVL